MAARKLPPIEGLPAQRPVCAHCGKKLRPTVNAETDMTTHPWTVVRRTFTGWDAYCGLFHSLNCALYFAVAAHRAGYRVKSAK